MLASLIVTLSLATCATCATAASPSEWRNRTIYQVLVDRFATASTSAKAGGGNLSSLGCDLHNYCGGTWKGLEDKLEYISNLGFDAIWISPVVKNTPGGYHGYWAQNLSAINDHFGTEDDLKSLVSTAHSKGIWVLLDVVGNHMGGSINDIGGYWPFNDPSHYHDCQGCQSDCSISDFNTLYSYDCEHCRLAGLPDLNQDNGWVAGQLTSWIKGIVEKYNFDGIRVDTVPEVKPTFWKSFNQAAGTFAIGEVFNGDINYVSPYQGQALDSVLSYPIFFQIRNVFAQGQSFQDLSQLSNQMKSKFSDPTLLGTFVDNHDNQRYLNVDQDQVRYSNALLFSIFYPGIPIVYYGTEQQFSGGNDPENREVMWTSGYSEDGYIYKFLRNVLAKRSELAPWDLPDVQYLWADNSLGVYSRGGTLLVVTTNAGSNAQGFQVQVPVNGLVGDGTQYCDSLTNQCITVNGGHLPISIVGGQPQLLIKQ